MNSYDEAREKLAELGQEQVLQFWKNLDEEGKKALLQQIGNLDRDSLAAMLDLMKNRPRESLAADIVPAEVLCPDKDLTREGRRLGEAALRDGVVGALLVAGGQGSRLGFDGPKGAFPIGPVSDATLFEIHAHKILSMGRKYDVLIPFYIMTSGYNDVETREFFRKNAYFGLRPDQVIFFQQHMWPALSEEGKIVLDRPGHIFLSPDGHGGLLSALKHNRIFHDMEQRGITTLFYFQADNPLVQIGDPVFIGLHAREKSEMSSKVCEKRTPDEKLGVVVKKNGRDAIVEYSELTEGQKNERSDDGKLTFRYGSVAIHVFSVDFLLRQSGEPMALHLAHKKVPHCDDEGQTIEPTEPNAYKFEKFIFDILPNAERTLTVAFDRMEEFSPVKNAKGSDSPETARRDMSRKFSRWLERCGVDIPKDAAGNPRHAIEIDPLFACEQEELCRRIEAGMAVERDVFLSGDQG